LEALWEGIARFTSAPVQSRKAQNDKILPCRLPQLWKSSPG
jgi:hypothetical protein